MARGALGRAAVVIRTLILWGCLTVLLLRMYSLYIAVALTPQGRWRRRLEFQFRRALFAMQHVTPR